MANTAANDNYDLFEDGFYTDGSYYTPQQYRDELSTDIEMHPAEIMAYSTDEELAEYLKSGSFEEKRYAQIEKCDRTLNLGLADMAGIPIEPELEKVICEIESSWNKEV
ncbi:MAG: hypothetical protein COB14_07495 [Alphaproteobacteria bacterium]|nr:MAG: hypothetical protein COB14_07495 [Alphaproteobacteria bacterium]